MRLYLITAALAILSACTTINEARECFTDECLQCVDDCLQPAD